MRELRLDVERDTMERDPALQPDADRGNLVLTSATFVGPAHPDPDAILAPLAADIEGQERADHPFFQRRDVAAHVGAALAQVEHQIGDPLARTVVGELAAAAGVMHRKARLDQVGGLRAGAGRIKRGMLQEPGELCRRSGRNRGGALLHGGERLLIANEALAQPPFHRGKLKGGKQPNIQSIAHVNHLLTIAWSGQGFIQP